MQPNMACSGRKYILATCNHIWLAHASVGCMYGRPSVIECDMHYARASVTECTYAYVYIYIKPHVMMGGGWHMGKAEPETIYHSKYVPWNGPSSSCFIN